MQIPMMQILLLIMILLYGCERGITAGTQTITFSKATSNYTHEFVDQVGISFYNVVLQDNFADGFNDLIRF